MSDGETVPLAYIVDLPEGTTVTGHDDFQETLMVRLSSGDFHEVPHPAPRPVVRVTLDTTVTMRALSFTTPPMERASSLRAFRDRRQERHRLLNSGDRP